MKKKIVILGAGESGIGAALLANSKGYEVLVSDFGKIDGLFKQELEVSGIPYEENGHSEACWDKALECVVKSPGIPEKAVAVQKIRENGIELISEMEFAYRFSSGKIIAITGSNGKTTTTLLVGDLLKKAGYEVAVGGNIGYSFARLVYEDNSFDYYVLEVSSFQLDDISTFKPDIALLLNITPDHLDRYGYDFRRYAEAKFNLLKNMDESDCLVFNESDPCLSEESRRWENKAFAKAAFGRKNIAEGGLSIELASKKEPFEALPLKGEHNALNIAAAILAVGRAGLSADEIREALPGFKNTQHRLEPVGSMEGVEFINDSKATNVDAAFYALKSFEKDVVWIVGGQDKGNDYESLAGLVPGRVKGIVCLGADNEKLKKAFQPLTDNFFETQNVIEAVAKGYEFASPKGVVLLSPACASFDLFKNYVQRGDVFRESVKEFIKIQTKVLESLKI